MEMDEVLVKVRLELATDGSYCALDASNRLVARADDLAGLNIDLDEIVKMAYGSAARVKLVVQDHSPE